VLLARLSSLARWILYRKELDALFRRVQLLLLSVVSHDLVLGLVVQGVYGQGFHELALLVVPLPTSSSISLLLDRQRLGGRVYP
jgi:hypothetical protein